MKSIIGGNVEVTKKTKFSSVFKNDFHNLLGQCRCFDAREDLQKACH